MGCGPAVNPSPPGASSADASTSGSLPVEAIARLTAALGRLRNGYQFTSTISVGSKVATQANGRWIAGASEFTVTTAGTSITYRTMPPRSWVLQAGQGWVEVNGSVPSGSPLDALRTPSQLTVKTQSGDVLELMASYPAAALGLAGSASVAVDLVLAADGSLTARYAAPTSNADSLTRITPDTGQAPIAAPAPS